MSPAEDDTSAYFITALRRFFPKCSALRPQEIGWHSHSLHPIYNLWIHFSCWSMLMQTQRWYSTYFMHYILYINNIVNMDLYMSDAHFVPSVHRINSGIWRSKVRKLVFKSSWTSRMQHRKSLLMVSSFMRVHNIANDIRVPLAANFSLIRKFVFDLSIVAFDIVYPMFPWTLAYHLLCK